jgi:hypothetical protein
MISKRMMKPKLLASQKVRRRWVIAYFVAFGLIFIVNLFDFDLLFEKSVLWAWVFVGIFCISAVLYIVSTMRGFRVLQKSEYRDMAILPPQMLDERQAWVRYKASERCFEILIAFFALIGIYIIWGPYLHLPFPTHESVRRLAIFGMFFIGNLRTAMIAWLEPDPIQEAPVINTGA